MPETQSSQATKKKPTSTSRGKKQSVSANESPPITSTSSIIKPAPLPQPDISKIVSTLPLDAISRLSSLLHEMSGSSGSKMEILAILARGKRSVGELVSVLNLSNSAVSQHLNKMKAYNVVECERSMHNQVYNLRDGLREEVMKLFREVFNLS